MDQRTQTAGDGLETAQHGAVALLTLNRPARLNALDAPLIDRLREALDAIEIDPATRAVVLTGAGERAFSAGADMHAFASVIGAGGSAAMRDFVRRGQALTSRIEAFAKPVIVAVNGLAYGGGCEIVEAAPLAIAAAHATFAKPEIRLGFPPPFGGTQRLARLVGRKRALAMILTAAPIGAAEALASGLVNRVAPAPALLDAAFEMAGAVLDHSPLAVAAALGAVTRGLNLSIDEGLAVEAASFARMLPTEDLREGIAAFREKRAPRFAGR
jgi:enoyl-CoA hydratase/carnithine racemase